MGSQIYKQSGTSTVIVCITLALGFAINHVATAGIFSWKSPVSNQFSNFNAWTPFGLPGPTDTANFNLGSAGYTVSFPASINNESIGNLQIGNDKVMFNLGKDTYNVVNTTSPAISLGNAAGNVANFTLENGTLLSQYSSSDAVGYAAMSNATMTIDGSGGPVLFQDGTLDVGYAGTGSVSLINGGAAKGFAVLGDQVGSQGTMTITGSGSTYTGGAIVGDAGTGNLSLSGSGQLLGGFDAGYQPGRTAPSRLAESARQWAEHEAAIYVGYSGTGNLSMTAGSTGTANTLEVGYQPGSQGTVTLDGAGTKLTAGGDIGGSGTGSLSITNGAKLAGGDFTVGDRTVYGSNSSGSATVDGTGSTLGAADLTIGNAFSGSASVTVRNGGTLNVAVNLTLNGVNGGGLVLRFRV